MIWKYKKFFFADEYATWELADHEQFRTVVLDFVYLYFLSVIATSTGLVLIYRYMILSKQNLYFRINVGNANISDKNIEYN